MLAVPAASARAPADVQPAVTAEARGSAAPAPTQKSIYESIKPVGGSGNSPPGSEYRSYNPVPAAPAPPPPSQKPHSDPSPDSQYGFGNLKLEENVDQSRVAARKQWPPSTRCWPRSQTARPPAVNMDTGTDREQRRLLRVRRELEKIQEVNEEEAVRKEQEKQEQHDLVEFAENYFNDQERCPNE